MMILTCGRAANPPLFLLYFFPFVLSSRVHFFHDHVAPPSFSGSAKNLPMLVSSMLGLVVAALPGAESGSVFARREVSAFSLALWTRLRWHSESTQVALGGNQVALGGTQMALEGTQVALGGTREYSGGTRAHSGGTRECTFRGIWEGFREGGG